MTPSKKISILDANGRPLRKSLDTSHFGASQTAKELRTWAPINFSADSALLPELDTLTTRSLDLVRNNGVASGAIQTLVDNVVGTGLRLSALPDYRALNKSKEWAIEWSRDVESKFREFADSTTFDAARQHDFASMTKLVFRTGLMSGEASIVPLWLPNRSGANFSTCLQFIDPARISNPNNGIDTPTMRSGIELSTYGEAIAYNVRDSHPGEVIGGMGMAAVWTRIPSRMRNGRRKFIHVFDPERAGQHRGKPFITPIMSTFKMTDHYLRAVLQSTVVQAMISAFLESPLTPESIAELFGGSLEDYNEQRKAWEIQLGMGNIIPMFPGDKMTAFSPTQPTEWLAPFLDSMYQILATGMNIPRELLMKDFSRTNYSSARAALLEAWRFFNGRRSFLGTYWAKPVYELWLEEAVQRGKVEAPDFYQNWIAYTRCMWIGDGRGWVDPVKEATGSKLRREAKVTTLQRECAEQGLDWEEVLEQLATEQTRMEELGLADETVDPALVAAMSNQPDNQSPQQGGNNQ